VPPYTNAFRTYSPPRPAHPSGASCECLGMEFRIGGHASVQFRVGGHARWLWPPIVVVVDNSISARIVLARGSTFGGSVAIWRSRKRVFFYGYGPNVFSFTHRASTHTSALHKSLLARNARPYISARSTGFCAIWVCISTSSSSTHSQPDQSFRKSESQGSIGIGV
jgi:hypothetical protein